MILHPVWTGNAEILCLQLISDGHVSVFDNRILHIIRDLRQQVNLLTNSLSSETDTQLNEHRWSTLRSSAKMLIILFQSMHCTEWPVEKYCLGEYTNRYAPLCGSLLCQV